MRYSDNNSITTILPEGSLSCANGETCEETINLSCFNYSGHPLININTSPNNKLSTIFQKIEAVIK
jgi:hypothetical protein